MRILIDSARKTVGMSENSFNRAARVSGLVNKLAEVSSISRNELLDLQENVQFQLIYCIGKF